VSERIRAGLRLMPTSKDVFAYPPSPPVEDHLYRVYDHLRIHNNGPFLLFNWLLNDAVSMVQ
jgi:hypothetical protein